MDSARGIRDIVREMTLEEKAGLCSGHDFWNTQAVERLGVPSFMLTDGPHGLRKQLGSADNLGLSESVPATCFPTAATTACSFDRGLLRRIGEAIGDEARAARVAVVLGPGANIKRSPLCGRNFEYFSEDPLVSGEMAAAFVAGVQSRNVGACMKHYACNNQERARQISDSIVDERALREIYLKPFEIAVRKSAPWTIMCAYNKLNGTYCCEHGELLSAIPRGEWGFDGMTVTDWGAMDDRVAALRAGLDLEMPGCNGDRDRLIAAAVRSGDLPEAVLDAAVARILEVARRAEANAGDAPPYDAAGHAELAREAVRRSAVLLKNEGALPLARDSSLAVIGEFAWTPRYQGAGSSKIAPTFPVAGAMDEFGARGASVEYARGYDLAGEDDEDALIEEAARAARGKAAVLVFAGLPDAYESEGLDRESLGLPASHDRLIERVARENPNVVVVLHSGGVVAMPWLPRVKAVLLVALGGQSVGAAAVDLLYGDANPSGKLAETYPLALEDNPSYGNFGGRSSVEYRESVFVGYRYYDAAGRDVLFPFGHGLSYTRFDYGELSLSRSAMGESDTVVASVSVRNSGERDGEEVVQLYVESPASAVYKPARELRGFEKLSLKAGEERRVDIALDGRAFAYWNAAAKAWHVESGVYRLLAGSSSRDIRASADIAVATARPDLATPSYRQAAPAYYSLSLAGPLDVPAGQFEAVLGRRVPAAPDPSAAITLNSTLPDAASTLAGRLVGKVARKMALGMADSPEVARMMEASVNETPLRAMPMMGVPLGVVEGLVLMFNRKTLKGLARVVSSLLARRRKV